MQLFDNHSSSLLRWLIMLENKKRKIFLNV